MNNNTATNHKIIKSPLRYPGSKQKFTHFMIDVFSTNNIKPDLLIEPFAGGASIALNLLQMNYVQSIALVEKDSLVASFWKTVFFDQHWLYVST
jgi:DNA adenine methylase